MASSRRDPRPVVVGVDGSAASLAALGWAEAQARRTESPLELVTAWPTPVNSGAVAIRTEGQARSVADGALAFLPALSEESPRLSVRIVSGDAGEVLLQCAATAASVVVGRHARHSIAEHILGSMTGRLLGHAACPVVVVPPGNVAAPVQHGIVVGVDGSRASAAALAWAAEQASVCDAKVHAILVWDWRAEYGVPPYGPTEQQQRARAEALLGRCVAALPDELRDNVISEAVRGRPAGALLRACAGADLLVVGNNRGGRLAGHLLGSVSRRVAAQAAVPVVVTHEDSLHRPAGHTD